MTTRSTTCNEASFTMQSECVFTVEADPCVEKATEIGSVYAILRQGGGYGKTK